MRNTSIWIALFLSCLIGNQLISGVNVVTISNEDVFIVKADFSVIQDEVLLNTLIGHSSEVWDISFSPDGTLLASASSDNTILVWDISLGQVYRNLTGHLDSVYCVAFHPYEPVLASGSYDKSIILWNLTSGDILFNLTGHTSSVWDLEFSPDGLYLASGSSDASVRTWEFSTYTSKYNLTGHTDSVRTLQYLPNGLLASGSYDDSILLWNISTGNLENILVNNTSNILSLTVNSQGSHLVSGSQDNLIKFWDLESLGDMTRPENSLNNWVRSLAYNSEGYYLASGLENGDINIWNDIENSIVINLTSHSLSIRSLDFHPSEPFLASASGDKTIKLWNVSDLDNDGLPDSWEFENGLSPNNNQDWLSDLDSDGLSNLLEYQFGTDPRLRDSDQDQIPDGYEYNNGLNGTVNDANGDQDQDGIPNLYEYQNGLNAGLNDAMSDSDSDGMPNLYEYENGLEAGRNDALEDLDNDGLPNYYEYQNNFIIGVDDGADDSDSDGLLNREEYILGTNPRDSDSDDDIFDDSIEVSLGTDPRNFYSNPFFSLIWLVIIIVSLVFFVLAVIGIYPRVKRSFISIRNDMQVKSKNTMDFLRTKASHNWIQDMESGRAIRVNTLTETLQTRRIELPKKVKTEMTLKRLENKSLVLRSDMLLLQPVPPKEASCQMCISDIIDTNYTQCEECKRFVCIHDYVDLMNVGAVICPNCSGRLIMFPFTCTACELDYSSVDELKGKTNCKLCGYSLIDQSSLISTVTSGLSPSKITYQIRDERKEVDFDPGRRV